MIILVVVFCSEERRRRNDFRDNRSRETTTCCQHIATRLSRDSLFFRVIEDGWGILRSPVLELTTIVRRIGLNPIQFKQTFIRD